MSFAPSRPGTTQENSAPRTSNMPVGSVAAAALHPLVVSWSVRATTSRPAAAAAATSSTGESVPSEAVEWVCRSIRGRPIRAACPKADNARERSLVPARAGQHARRPRLALLTEDQLGQRLVDLLGAGY